MKPLRIGGIINISFMSKVNNNTKFTVTTSVQAANRAKEALICPPRACGSWLIYVMMVYFLTCLITPRFQRRTLQLAEGASVSECWRVSRGERRPPLWFGASAVMWQTLCFQGPFSAAYYKGRTPWWTARQQKADGQMGRSTRRDEGTFE